MAPSATGTQSMSSKIKRPVPPGIQTNGIHSSTSPSPSMSASRLPSAIKPPNSATIHGAASNNGVRTASRRRDAPPHLLGRGQRNSSVGLRSAGLVGESLAAADSEPQPYVKSDEYILKKHRGKLPSLVIHLHPTHFRFDLQEGHFPYQSPMGKVLMEGLKDRVIPADLVEHFSEQPFYEDCMIVQIYDHKSLAPAQPSDRVTPASGKTAPFSIHNYNALLTPSSYVPFQQQNNASTKAKDAAGDNSKSPGQRDKENMPAPSLPSLAAPRKPKVTTIVLRPTPLTRHIGLASATAKVLSGDTGDLRDGGTISASIPPTPTTGAPPTPQVSMPPPAKRQKKVKTQLDSAAIYAMEGEILRSTTAPLFLDPVDSAAGVAALLESLAHPSHSENPPAPKTRKRTVAEMAADEALAAEQERFMLLLDERLSSTSVTQGGTNPAGGEGQAGGASFEPRFERFKVIESIKAKHEEDSRIAKEKELEKERKNRQDQERNKLEEGKRQEQERQRVQQAQAQQQRQQALNDRQRQMAEQQARAQMQGAGGQMQHAHPQTNGIANGMPAQPQRFHQQVSQAQNSSPIIRNGTPQSNSSPIINGMGAPMQQSNSQMGGSHAGSPPRPGSVVHQNPQMGAPMVPQRSQQSHAGTPRMPMATPNTQSTPLNRQASQPMRMPQGSPMQGGIPQTPGVQMMPNGQPMMNAQAHAQQQMMQSQRMMQLQQQQATNGMNGMNGTGSNQISPQQMQMFMRAQQQQRAQAQAQGMGNNVLTQNYQQQMAAMTRAQQNGGVPQNMNQAFMNGQMGNIQMNAAQIQQLQLQQQMRAQQQQQAAMAAAQQQNHHPQQQQQGGAIQAVQQQQFMALANNIYMQQRQAFMAQNPGQLTKEMEDTMKRQAQATATHQIQRRRMQQQAMQQQAMQQQAMQNGMNGMNGMQQHMGM